MDYISDIRKKIGNDVLIVIGGCVFVYKDGKVLFCKDEGTITAGRCTEAV